MKKKIITTLVVGAFLGTALAQTEETKAPVRLMPAKVKEMRINGEMMRPVITGNKETDDQIKSLTTEMETKIKAIADEYQAKIKALVGDKKSSFIHLNDSTTTPRMRGEERRNMMSASGTPLFRGDDNSENRRPMMNASGTPVVPMFRMNENGEARNQNQNIENSQPQGLMNRMQGFFRGMFGR